MNFSTNEPTLLFAKQAFGSQRIDVIEKLGTKCSISDFAILLHGLAYNHDSDDDYDDNILKTRATIWGMRSFNKFGAVAFVDQNGKLQFQNPNSRNIGIRPVLPFSSISDIPSNAIRGKSGLLEVEYGEYPQYAVYSGLDRILDSELSAGSLKETGKTYTTDSNGIDAPFKPREHIEYEYKGKKYVKVRYFYLGSLRLSNDESYKYRDEVWVEVAPIVWYVDEKAKLMISKICLAAGVRFCNRGTYSSDFENSEMYMFLNKYFAIDIKPSIITEMTPEERNQYETARKENEKLRQNWEEEMKKRKEQKELKEIQHCISLIRMDSNNFTSLEDKYRANFKIAIEAVSLNGLLLEHVLGGLNDNEDVVLAAIHQNPLALQYASYRLRDDFEIVLEAVKGNPEAIIYASQRIKKDRNMILNFMKTNPALFKFLVLTNDLDLIDHKKNREIVLTAVKADGRNLIYAPNFYGDREIVLCGVSQERGAFCIAFVHPDFRNDEEIMTATCKINKLYIKYASERLRGKRSFIESVFDNIEERRKYSVGDLKTQYELELFTGLKAAVDNLVNTENHSHQRR